MLIGISAACAIRGTSFAEKGARVSVRREGGEEIVFYVIDDNPNPDCPLRQELDYSGKLCDLLVCRTIGSDSTATICLVELKGINVKKALEQILDTYALLRDKIQHRRCPHTVWKAYIRRHGSAPMDIRKYKEILYGVFGYNRAAISTQDDIGPLLRGDL